MRYQICEASDRTALETMVIELMQAGWLPTGGVNVTYSAGSGNWWYYQALISVEPMPPPAEEASE